MADIWPYWINTVQTTTSATTDPYYEWAWQSWQGTGNQLITGGTGAPLLTSAQASTIWINWQASGTPAYVPQRSSSDKRPAVEPVRLSPQEEAAQDRRILIHRQRSHAARLRRNIAGRRAETLLLEHLNDQQREQWTTERAFTVHTADGKRAYHIAYGLAGNIRLVKADEPPISKEGVPLAVGACFCMHVCHPEGAVPHQDNVLAQKLLIEANEQHFLELANAS